MHVVLLAAGLGMRLRPYTEVRPKCMMEVGGITLLERHTRLLVRQGASRLTVVVGHLAEMIEVELARVKPALPFNTLPNPVYTQGSILSLQVGLERVDDDLVFMDADVLYHPDVLGRLFRTQRASCLLVDASATESGEEMMVGLKGGRAQVIARRVSHLGPFEHSGESVGFFRIAQAHLPLLKQAIEDTLSAEGDGAEYESALNRFFHAVPVGAERVDDLAWTEIDFEEDLRRAREEIEPKLPGI